MENGSASHVLSLSLFSLAALLSAVQSWDCEVIELKEKVLLFYQTIETVVVMLIMFLAKHTEYLEKARIFLSFVKLCATFKPVFFAARKSKS